MVSHHGLSLTELVNLWDCFFIFTFQSAVMLYLMKKKLTLYVCLVLICNCNEKKKNYDELWELCATTTGKGIYNYKSYISFEVT